MSEGNVRAWTDLFYWLHRLVLCCLSTRDNVEDSNEQSEPTPPITLTHRPHGSC